MTDIPTTEPLSLSAGLTWRWRREDLAGDYPASAGWVLTYYLRSASGHYDIAATADGDYFAVTVAASTTATYAAGRYDWEARVALSGAVHRIGQGSIVVEPNFAAASNVDARSHARKTLDAIEAVIEGRASKDQEGYRIENRELRRTPVGDLLRLRGLYRAEVAAEQAALDLANGRGGRRRILTRFAGG